MSDDPFLDEILSLPIVAAARRVPSGEIAIALRHLMRDGDLAQLYAKETPAGVTITDASLLLQYCEMTADKEKQVIAKHGFILQAPFDEITGGPFPPSMIASQFSSWKALAAEIDSSLSHN